MKLSIFLILAFAGILISMTACSSKKTDPATQENTTTTGDTVIQGDPATTTAAVTSGHHFICPNNCAGSGGTEAGKCPVCGTEYVHNAAFHQGSNPPATTPAMKIDPTTNAAVPTVTEPKNASGVYHFICPKGHEGGAGAAGNCAKCGTPLEHNQAYHNN